MKCIYINYQRPICAVTKRRTNLLTITSIDLKLHRYDNETTASVENPHIQLNRNSFLIYGPHTTFRAYNIL